MIGAMRTFRNKYDGVEWVSKLLKESLEQLDLMRFDQTNSGHQALPQLKSDDPAITYLRVAFTVEVSLSRSRFAQKDDFPQCLAGLFQDKPLSLHGDRGAAPPREMLAALAPQTSPMSLQADWEQFFVLDERSNSNEVSPRSQSTRHVPSGESFESLRGSSREAPTTSDLLESLAHSIDT